MSIYLAAGGVGELRICDFNHIDLSNLNRQILHSDRRISQLKAVSAQTTLLEFIPLIDVEISTDPLRMDKLEQTIRNPILLNAYTIALAIPLGHGAVQGMMGQVTFLVPPQTQSLQCSLCTGPSFNR